MASLNFNTKYRFLLATICCTFSCYGQLSYTEEVATRRSNASSAYELLKSGDSAYNNGDYTQAVSDFAQAIDSLPTGTRTATLRTELGDRYATAASQEAKRLVSKGDLTKAKELLNESLIYAPNNSYAKSQLDRIHDPIATNPALTPEHVSNVDQVRRLLYKAEGAYNLGKFDEANATYNKVLQIDKYNKAARRGMEKVEARKTGYYDSAYDQTRAKMLSEVDKEWEMPVQNTESGMQAEFLSAANQQELQSTSSALQKLEAIVIPRVSFDDMDIYEALDNLRALSKQYDTTTINPELKGLQFVAKFNQGAPEVERRFNLNLSNVPIIKVIDSITELLGIQYNIDGPVINLTPYGGSSGALLVKNYAVAPDFLTLKTGANEKEIDPFSSNKMESQSTLAGSRTTAKELLESYGIEFSSGATASYLRATSTLIVKNTEVEHQVIARILNELSQKQPLMVEIEVKLISVSQNNTEELGTDMSLDGTILEAVTDGLFSGGSTGNGREIGDLIGRPMTAGNRSGDSAVAVDSINSAITRTMGRIPNANSIQDVVALAAGNDATISDVINDVGETASLESTSSAPGVLSVAGSLNPGYFTALLRGLDQKKGTDFMQKPSFITQSGQQAKVTVGREFIYPTEYDIPEISEGSESFRGDNDNDDDDDGQVGADMTWYLEWDRALNLVYAEILGVGFSDQTSSVTPSHPTTFETKVLGTELDVLPTVSNDGQTIDIGIKATHRELEGFINYGSPLPGVSINLTLETPLSDRGLTLQDLIPLIGDGSGDFDFFFSEGNNPVPPGPEATEWGPVRISTSLFQASENKILMPVFQTLNIETSVTAYDGATLIIGGLIESTPIKVEDKTPILGNIPLVGKLFTSEVDNAIKKQVIIAITAKVVDPTGRRIKGSL